MGIRRSDRRIGGRVPHPYAELSWTERAGRFPRKRTVEHKARIVNLSPTGMLIETAPQQVFKLGEMITATIAGGRASFEVVRITSAVQGENVHYGVIFHWMSDEVERYIRDYDPRKDQRELLDAWLTSR